MRGKARIAGGLEKPVLEDIVLRVGPVVGDLTGIVISHHVLLFPASDAVLQGADEAVHGPVVDIGHEGRQRVRSTGVHLAGVVERFHAVHKQTYGYSYAESPDQRIEWVNSRVMGVGPIRRPAIQAHVRTLDGGTERACTGRRHVYFDQGFVDTPIFARPRLQPGDRIAGPAIIEEFGSTTVVFPGLQASVDDYANLILKRKRD